MSACVGGVTLSGPNLPICLPTNPWRVIDKLKILIIADVLLWMSTVLMYFKYKASK